MANRPSNAVMEGNPLSRAMVHSFTFTSASQNVAGRCAPPATSTIFYKQPALTFSGQARDRARLNRGAFACDQSPNEENDDRTDDCTNESGALSCLIPSQRLAEPCGDECANDAENSRQDETLRLIRPGHN